MTNPNCHPYSEAVALKPISDDLDNDAQLSPAIGPVTTIGYDSRKKMRLACWKLSFPP
ncbi:hypothetical protein M413DRAFT_442343 [Hebeloma cylindrosporum]|uniref:Uncharacterized protein n=1 Tax=Hebeloma cylindrosporum TaxID=76867 RepID=A0A0C3CA75_HEBCY|nr:hypothetical protein M413DRAFT_442343 [Hebeloma cylindrosporum h7]